MPSILKLKRTISNAATVPALQQGEIAINLAKRQLYVGGASGNIEVIAIRYFDEASSYAIGDHVIRDGALLRCTTAVVPGPFDNGDWGSAAGGVPDVPNDNITYVRRNMAWVQATPALVGSPPLEPNDGKAYLRKAAQWVEALASQIKIDVVGSTVLDFYNSLFAPGAKLDQLDDADSALATAVALRITDAPSDGNSYVRRNAAWTMLGGIAGDVVGPAGGVAGNDLVVFDGTTGKIIGASGVNLSQVPQIGTTNNWSGTNQFNGQLNSTASASFTGNVDFSGNIFVPVLTTSENSAKAASTSWVKNFLTTLWTDSGSIISYVRNLSGFGAGINVTNSASTDGSYALFEAKTGRSGATVQLRVLNDPGGTFSTTLMNPSSNNNRKFRLLYDDFWVDDTAGTSRARWNATALDMLVGEYFYRGAQLGYGNGLTGFGTVANKDTGVAAGQVPILDGSANLAESVYPDDAFYFRAGSFRGFQFVNTDGTTIAADHFGYVISCGIAGANPVINLPLSNAFGSAKEGGAILIENLRDDANLIVRNTGTNFWYYPPAGLSNTPSLSHDLILGPRQTLIALARGTDEWNPIGGSWRTIQNLANSAQRPVATAAEYSAATANRVLGAAESWGAVSPQTITYAATITPNFGARLTFDCTLTGNVTVGNPTNVKAGQSGFLRLTQDATGGRTVAFASNWKFASRIAPSATPTANAADLVYFTAISSSFIHATMVKDVR